MNDTEMKELTHVVCTQICEALDGQQIEPRMIFAMLSTIVCTTLECCVPQAHLKSVVDFFALSLLAMAEEVMVGENEE